MANEQNRNDRQATLFPQTILSLAKATVVGVGAIGHQVAIQLAAIGVPTITLVDFDTIEIVNLGPQAFPAADVGKTKVSAVASRCRALNPDIRIEEVPRRISLEDDMSDILFCCVDSIDTRNRIFTAFSEQKQNKHALFVDGRMSAETLRILTAEGDIAESLAYYRTTLFPEAEAFHGECTAKSTVFTANIAAGFMVEQFSKWTRNIPRDRDILMNLLSMECADMTKQVA
jgi:sulfur carrier protein ThiS adenylyltransferase